MDDFLDDKQSTSLAEWFGAIRLLFVLLFMILNPLNWKNISRAGYYYWLKRTKQYEKLLGIWDKKTPTTSVGKIVKSLEMTDCYIQLERYTEGINCLKGLSEQINACEKDDEWKERKHRKSNFYRKTIYGLAKLPIKKQSSKK